ncbi:MAG: 16S rRNA (guanine(966)-N(2))-methyltransferase RsmD [Pseudomonadota bacterium]
MLRVVGGSWRGRRLRTPVAGVRPTADRVREAIFNILGQHLDDERVLDLYAGSGALGIEALSRGARQAVFVEQSPRVAEVIRANLDSLGATDRAQVLVMDARSFISRPEDGLYDTVLADPPYRDLPEAAFWNTVLLQRVAPGGRLVIEHAARDQVELGAADEVRVRRYGDTAVTLGRRPPHGAPRPAVIHEDKA